MHRAAELEVAAEADGQVFKAALAPPYRKKVCERLRRMLVAAVARVDDGHVRAVGGDAGRALLRVAHDGDVRIAGDGADGVRDALTLGDGAGVRLREADHLAAQAQHRRLKAKARAGARFVEQCCQPLTGSYIFIGSRVIMDTVCKVHQVERFFQREIRRVDQMSHTQSPLFTLFIPNGAVPFKIKSACAPSQSQRNPYSRSGSKARACRCGNSRSHPAAKAPAPGAAPAGGGYRASPARRAASSASR